MPLPNIADPRQRFDTTLRALLAVKKTELQEIDAKLKAIQKEKDRRTPQKKR
jgi:hypothetical protein